MWYSLSPIFSFSLEKWFTSEQSLAFNRKHLIAVFNAKKIINPHRKKKRTEIIIINNFPTKTIIKPLFMPQHTLESLTVGPQCTASQPDTWTSYYAPAVVTPAPLSHSDKVVSLSDGWKNSRMWLLTENVLNSRKMLSSKNQSMPAWISGLCWVQTNTIKDKSS